MFNWLWKKDKKVAIIGLDSADPVLVFDKWHNDLPNLKGLRDISVWGLLESTHPPITVPAWTSMMTGKDPGQLGIYGFRNRKDYSYDGYSIANSNAICHDRVWDILSRNGKKVILLGVPQTYPPKPVNGYIVTDFLTPSTGSEYTYPVHLKAEVERVSEGYVLDVENFRTHDKEALLERIYEKTRKHFRVAKYLLSTKPWDFFMMVEMGVDRIHHGFWSYMDPAHRKYQKGTPFENAIRDYYKYVDHEVGGLLDLFPRDTVVMVVSDHGAKKMEGGICFNQWLIEQGYLKLLGYPQESTPLSKVEIDWSKTIAWGEGGYHGRLFMNVKGREPQGVVDPKDYEKVRDELKEKIEAICDPEGKNIGTKAYKPEEIYPHGISGIPPDLIVYFGNLDWRSVGSVGTGSIYTFENDTGPDEANHDWYGIFIMKEADRKRMESNHRVLRIQDITPIILQQFEIPIPM